MLTQPNTPPHRLDLKANAVCAIQRNMSVETGLVRNAQVRTSADSSRFRFLIPERYIACFTSPSLSVQRVQAEP
ncbi:hypothetical protein EV424DRAFT_1382147, partial [Suillus variegatus]